MVTVVSAERSAFVELSTFGMPFGTSRLSIAGPHPDSSAATSLYSADHPSVVDAAGA